MLSREDRRRVHEHAHVPEHLPDYVEAVSGREGHLLDAYLCFCGSARLTLVGYPLGRTEERPEEAFARACDRFQPKAATLVAPEIRLPGEDALLEAPDRYYRLALPLDRVPPDVAYMIRRGRRELRVREGTFRRAHRRAVKAFLADRDLTPEQRRIFTRIPAYLKRSGSARLLEAWQGKTLAAFDVVDTGSRRSAFYLFNIRAPGVNVPGASDLLLWETVELARREGKDSLNLGLGLHSGVRRFKEKWGATPFLVHASATVHREPAGLDGLWKKL